MVQHFCGDDGKSIALFKQQSAQADTRTVEIQWQVVCTASTLWSGQQKKKLRFTFKSVL